MIGSRANALFSWIDRRFFRLAIVCLLAAIGLALVGTAVSDTDEPSFDPDGEIYDIANRADEIFGSTSTRC